MLKIIFIKQFRPVTHPKHVYAQLIELQLFKNIQHMCHKNKYAAVVRKYLQQMNYKKIYFIMP
jgi:hypothetical protein